MKLISYNLKMESGRKERNIALVIIYLITLMSLFKIWN